jgi:hypothetical protein
VNAYTEAGRVHFDNPASDMVVFPFFPLMNGESFDPQRAAPRMERWTLDLSGNASGFERRLLDGVVAESPPWPASPDR